MISQEAAAQVLRAALARGGESAELYLERTSSTGLRLDGGRLDEAVSGVDQGAGLSLIDRERTLYGNSNRIDPDSLLRLADRLARAQSAAGGTETPSLPAGLPGPIVAVPADVLAPFAARPLPLVSPVSIPAPDVPMERKVVVLRRADAAARACDPRVTQVTIQYRDTEQRVTVADSDGTWGSEVRPYIVLHVTVVAREGSDIRTGMEARSETRGFEFFDRHLPEDIAREAARQAIQQLGARPAPAGTFTVVLSSKAGGTMVHEACGHGLEADFILKSMSVYSGKLGQQVASPLVTVVDDGTLPSRRGSSSMDDEGIATTRAVLIDKGVLKGYLQSRRTARLMKMRPTGHGRRESYHHLPLPRMRNTLILPGEHDPEAILAEVQEGVLVCRMGGGEVDVASGNFVFSCSEAYMIRNGRVAEPIRDATLIGNGPEVLRSIDRVGRDLGFGVGTCGKEGQGVPVANAQPTLRIPRITVGGTAAP
jgi:TldD protein